MIEVEKLTKIYGTHTAIQDVSFRVAKGEILGLLGPNGAGKTTTMRILSGFFPSTLGTARVAGFDVLQEPLEVKRRVGYLPENPPLYLEMGVDSFLRFVAAIKGVEKDKIRRRVEETKKRCGLQEQGDRLIKHLSKGFRQRVGLAQALIHKPEVLILDEPTSGLDPNQIIEVRNLIKSLGGDHTVILSTHVLPEVSMTCGRVIILNRGRIAAEGSPAELTASLRKGAQIHLEVAGAVEQLPGILQGLPGVRQASLGQTLNGHWPLTVETDGDVDVRAALARSVVEAGCDLLHLQRQSMSLEEIFLALTTEEAPAQRSAAVQQQESPDALEEEKPASSPGEAAAEAEKQEEEQ